MKQKVIIGALAIIIVILMALSTIPMSTTAGPYEGENLALTAVASHGGGGSGSWGPQRLNNGDKIGTYNDCWTTYRPPGNWVELTWKTPVTIGSMIVYYTRYRTYIGPQYCLHKFDVQWWDGSSFRTDQSVDDKDTFTNRDHYVELTQSVTTTRLRLSNMVSRGTYNIMIQEWEVFGGASGIPAVVKLEPQSLNLDSMGNYVQVKVEGFPDNPEYSPMDVDGSSVTVGGVNVDLKYGTYNNNRWIGKADRLLVEDAIGAPGNQVEVEVSGNLKDSTGFTGAAIIKAL